MTRPGGEVPDAALTRLEEHARRGKRPGPHLAREVLLDLGRLLREESPRRQGWLQRAQAAGRTAGAAWEAAVRDELSLAVGEFAQCLDPRYLDLPAYDMEYTQEARSRLEDRLRAARELGFELSSREAEVLTLADRVLASALERRRRNLEGLGEPAPDPRVKPTRSRRND